MKYAHTNRETDQLLGWYDDTFHDVIPEGSVSVTEEQWIYATHNSHNLVRPDGSSELADYRTFLSTEELAEDVRRLRKYRLETQVDPIAGNSLRWADLTVEKQSEWSDYRKKLLSITEQPNFPHTVDWPTEPK
jgi:hypothetical protein